ELAQNIVSGNGYVFEPGGAKVFHRPPLYPLMLIPGVLLPHSLWRIYVALLNSALVGISATIVLWWGRKLFGPRIAGIAWLLFGFNPWIQCSVKNPLASNCQVLAFILIVVTTWGMLRRIIHKEHISIWYVGGYTCALLMGSFSHGTMLV